MSEDTIWFGQLRMTRWSPAKSAQAHAAENVEFAAGEDGVGVVILRWRAGSLDHALRVIHEAVGLGPADFILGHPKPSTWK